MLKINLTELPKDQFYSEVCNKTQIVLHHTVSDPESAIGDVGSWKADSARIATYAIISADGTINKCFPSNNWAHHIGLKAETLKEAGFEDYATRNTLLNQHSIAIELDCWGGLVEKGGKLLNAYGKPINPKLPVVKCDWRGFTHFQAYTDAQIQTLSELLPILMKANKIQKYGIMDGNFDVRKDAMQGVSGIFSHSSFRADKSDLYPDSRLISMLKNLNV